MLDPAGFLVLMLSLSMRYRFSVTSWIRTPDRNQAVGGHPDSFHMVGMAVDIVFDRPEDMEKFLEKASRYGLRAIDEKDHVHVQPA